MTQLYKSGMNKECGKLENEYLKNMSSNKYA